VDIYLQRTKANTRVCNFIFCGEEMLSQIQMQFHRPPNIILGNSVSAVWNLRVAEFRRNNSYVLRKGSPLPRVGLAYLIFSHTFYGTHIVHIISLTDFQLYKVLQISDQVRRKPWNRAPIESFSGSESQSFHRQQSSKTKRGKTFVANALSKKP
jgi:hypothetical protein